MPVEDTPTKLHVVLLTLGAQGHTNPFTILATKLASLGVSVTLLLPTSDSLKCLNSIPEALDINISALENAPDLYTLPPPRVIVRGIRRPLDFTRVTFPSPAASLKQALRDMLHDPASLPPSAVIHDAVSYWAVAPIDELGLPRYVLNTSATSHLALGLYLFANPDNTNNKGSSHYIREEAERQGVVRVPGLPTVPWEEVGMEHKVESDVFYLGEKNARETLLGSNGILLNSSHALEGSVIAGLRASYPDKAFFSVGPLLSHMKKTSKAHHPCLSWLDEQPSRSVVYISFGSWASLSVEQIRELALGLEMSNKSFLWVLPMSSGERSAEDMMGEILPEGFLGRVHGRGVVYPDWVPQPDILGHASVGGFITHCGWNSVTECVTLGGVPMLAWPFVYDQPLTGRYLVEVLEVGVEIYENGEGVADRKEVCRAVLAMDDPKLRERAVWLRRKVGEENDSNKALDEFVKQLLRIT